MSELIDQKTKVTRLLLAEPNELDAKIVISFVEKVPGREFIIDHVTCVANALDHLQRSTYDLLILNLDLKDSSGVRTLEQLKGYLGQTPVLILTAGHQTEMVPEAVKLGALDFVAIEQISFRGLWRSINFVIDRKKIEVELTRARDTNKRSSDAKTQFISNVTHEIRNPLNSILGMSEVLNDLCENYEQQRVIKGIQSSGAQILSLVNDLLDVAKIESGKMEVIREIIKIEDFVETLMGLTVVRAHQKNIELYCDIDPSVGVLLEGDSHKIRQSVVNIISNAIKFTESGSVSFEVKALGPDQENEGVDFIEFKISDTGIGMEPEEVERIFEKFSQANTGVANRFGGTGLGLHITKQFIDFLGGEIEVTSEKGKGTEFSFKVPMKILDKELDIEPVGIVENSKVVFFSEEFSTRMTRRFFTDLGFEMTLEERGFQEYISEHDQKDWIVVDITGPAKINQDLIKSLTGFKKRNPEKKLITLLPYTFESTDIENLKLNKICYLLKPPRRNEVAEVIKRSLDQEALLDGEQGPPYLGLGPFKNTLEASGMTKAAKESPKQDLKKVLIVDDSEDNRNLYSLFLKDLQLEIEFAENGMEAINLFRCQKFDLVLMDLQMPIMDGEQAIKEIRKFESNTCKALVPIIAISGTDISGEGVDPCERYQCDKYILKPFAKKDLVLQVRTFLFDRFRPEAA